MYARKTAGCVLRRPRRLVHKITLGQDLLTGRRSQVTRLGFRIAGEAAQARRELLAQVSTGQIKPSAAGMRRLRTGEMDAATRRVLITALIAKGQGTPVTVRAVKGR